jgi:hypothetical protein
MSVNITMGHQLTGGRPLCRRVCIREHDVFSNPGFNNHVRSKCKCWRFPPDFRACPPMFRERGTVRLASLFKIAEHYSSMTRGITST